MSDLAANFYFIPSIDIDIEDDSYELKRNTNINIQVDAFGSGYFVNRYDPEEMVSHSLGEFESLTEAMRFAMEIETETV